MGDHAKTDVVWAIGRVFLARPDLHNAFNEVMIAEITEAFAELGKRDDVRVIILAGEGKSFCAGGDIHWMKKMVGRGATHDVYHCSVSSAIAWQRAGGMVHARVAMPRYHRLALIRSRSSGSTRR